MALSRTKRRVIVILFVLLFIVLAPGLIFYATGNKFGEGWNILPTGGIYFRSVPPGSEIYINSKLSKTIGYFERDILIKSLSPDVYSVLIKKADYNSWANQIKVSGNFVSDSRVFMLPKEIKTLEIKKFIEGDVLSSTTAELPKKLNPDYQNVVSLFSTTTLSKALSRSTSTSSVLGTSDNPIVNRNLELWREGGNIFLEWTGKLDSIPRIFCAEDICENIIKVYSFNSEISNLGFFPGESEIILVSLEGKIYALESEINTDKVPQLLYSGQNPDFRILNNNNIYVKDLDFYGQIEI